MKPIEKEELLAILDHLCLIKDGMLEAKKSLTLFDSSDNWNHRYTDNTGKIEKFNFLDYDPRILAGNGLRPLEKALERIEHKLLYSLRANYNGWDGDNTIKLEREDVK